jgi:small subunit ribosomal protein S6
MIITPESSDNEVDVTVDKVKSFIVENGGEVAEPENWGLRQMAYPIKHFHEGNYVRATFTMDSSHLQQLNMTLNASEEIIRHLVMKSE